VASVPLNSKALAAVAVAPVSRENWRRLANWLLVWVVIANAGFALLWFVGAPPRPFSILVFGALGLLVRNAPRWFQFGCFCAAMIGSVLNFIAALFNLSVLALLYSLQFFVELDPLNSADYLVVAGAIVVLTGLAWRALGRSTGFTDIRLILIAGAAVWGFSQLDIWIGQGMRGHYKRVAVEGAPFTSAVQQSHLQPLLQPAASGEPQRNLMIVMVESLGSPAGNPEMERLLFARYRQPAVAARFALSSGETTYYNSTTAAEIRELCGRWGDYYDLLQRDDETCLPARLRAQGFDTTAFHTFAGSFFARDVWYPNIGFEQDFFADDLLKSGAEGCGGLFPGVCDRDVPELMAEHLKQADGPQFVYWLTLNTHLPVPPGNNLDSDDCGELSPSLNDEFPMICRQFAIWDDIDAALIEEITAADFPPTDILIVGDHMPPYYDRDLRSQFEPDTVPWLLLRWRGENAAADGAALAARRARGARG
jgi:hypothetical protein